MNRQLESQGRAFAEQGGFTENLYHRRRKALEGTQGSDGTTNSDDAGLSGKPACPVCGKPMVRRVSRKGARAGHAFWGCSGYPGCTGTRPFPRTLRD